MPAFETMDRRDFAVYWPVTGVDRFNEPVVGDPCQVLINWSPDHRIQRFPDGTNVEVVGDATVGRSMCLGDLLWIGKLQDFDAADIPANNPLMQVVRYKEDSDIKGRFKARKVTLAKFHRQLPASGGA